MCRLLSDRGKPDGYGALLSLLVRNLLTVVSYRPRRTALCVTTKVSTSPMFGLSARPNRCDIRSCFRSLVAMPKWKLVSRPLSVTAHPVPYGQFMSLVGTVFDFDMTVRRGPTLVTTMLLTCDLFTIVLIRSPWVVLLRVLMGEPLSRWVTTAVSTLIRVTLLALTLTTTLPHPVGLW